MVAKPVSTPVDVSAKVDNDEDSELVDKTLYPSAIGSLLYLSTNTHPDITFSVCNVSRYCSAPTKLHWLLIERIFTYLRGTIDFGMIS